MSRSKKGNRPIGYDYWTRRLGNPQPPGRVAKDITNGKERAAKRQTISKIRKELE